MISVRRDHLLPLQQQALMVASQIRAKRDHALFSTALGAGLSARAIHWLDIGHVSNDGLAIRTSFEIVATDKRTFTANDNGMVVLPRQLREILAQHVARTRAICPHFVRPMRDKIGADGVRRCETCGHAVDLLQVPLFLSRLRDRLSTRRMRSLFESYREQLRLPEHLHFDSLKATFDAGRVTDLNAA